MEASIEELFQVPYIHDFPNPYQKRRLKAITPSPDTDTRFTEIK